MNASANQPSRDRLMADQRANEPSMEEILASIRRIISESESVTGQAGEPVKAPTAPSAIVEVTQRAKAEPVLLHRGTQQPSSAATQDATKLSIFDEPLDLCGSILPQAKVEPVSAVAMPEPRLLSTQNSQSISSAFSALGAAKLAHENLNFDGIAREMLRPMLKSWLDDNLPTLVERLVRAEIERVARGTN